MSVTRRYVSVVKRLDFHKIKQLKQVSIPGRNGWFSGVLKLAAWCRRMQHLVLFMPPQKFPEDAGINLSKWPVNAA